MTMRRIALLHLAPVVNDVGHNRSLLESAVRADGEQDAHRAITPELWVSGYSFIAQSLKDKGARALVSSAACGPGNCGPSGEREQRTLDTGLPIMVCNRSGIEDDGLDFRRAESVVAQHGRRLLTGTCGRSAILSFDWDMETMTLLSPGFHRTYV